MTAPLINDYFLHDKDRLRHDEAIALLRARMENVVGTEIITANNALNRILADDQVAPHDIPLHTNAAVDGYAFRPWRTRRGKSACFEPDRRR